MAWYTRREVRDRAETKADPDALLSAYYARLRRLSDEYLRLMGEHIADIGKLWPSDVHRLQQIRRMNRNLKQIERQIGAVAGLSADEIEDVFRQIAQEDVRMETKILGAPDMTRIEDNVPLQRILRAQARETADSMRNLSNTTVVSGFYRKAVDEAVSAVQSGVEDYGSAIRRVIREAGAAGLRVLPNGTKIVDYESGFSRRLDTAARMNVLDGARHLNQDIMEEVGRQFGADGVEIDAHMLCAEDHLPYQGEQYTQQDFESIQDGLDRPFGEWNCRHSWHPIIMGISPRTYSPEELDQMRRYSTEEIEIDGRTKTRYQWSQEMRRVETAIRAQKDTAILAKASGDTVLQRRCQGMVTELLKQYDGIAAGTGLQPEYQRTYVAGFRDWKTTEKRLTGTDSGGTMLMAAGENVRNTKDLTEEQVNKAIDFAVSLGMPRELIEYRPYWQTAYWCSESLDGFAEFLRLGNDLYPAENGRTANERVTWKGAIGHELVGHRATCLRKTNGEPLSPYDEAQASIRAAKFTPGLTDDERKILLEDAADRLRNAGMDYNETTKSMDIMEA